MTKVLAAKRAARSGTTTIIAGGRDEAILQRIREGRFQGTTIEPAQAPLVARKQWLAGRLQIEGRLILDQGAVDAIRSGGRSLLPVGVKAVEGRFARGDLVACMDLQQREVARGLVNYSSYEAERIKGRGSQEIEGLLGYVDEPELIHRDNLVLTDG